MAKQKICLLGNSLSTGGASRVHATLSNLLADAGMAVHNVILTDKVTYPFSGKLTSFAGPESEGTFGFFRRFLAFRRFMRRERFDYIIDFRNRSKPWQELIFNRMALVSPHIVTVHSYRTDWYFPGPKSLARHMFKDAFKIVAVASEIEERIRSEYGYTNVTTIVNPLEFDKIDRFSAEIPPFDFDYVLGSGRMYHDNNKQFDLMMKAYAASALPARGIRLVLLGDGPQRPELERIAGGLGIRDQVIFEGFRDNPFPYMKAARFLMLTSRNEGLPNVIAEALACGTPVVSFDCRSGPADLVADGENGLLVADQDFDAFVSAIGRMASDTILYQHCKANARKSVEWLSADRITDRWISLLNKTT